MSLEEDYSYNCPYCMAPNSIKIDTTITELQTLVTDCEVCCRAIEIEVSVDEDGFIMFDAKREDD